MHNCVISAVDILQHCRHIAWYVLALLMLAVFAPQSAAAPTAEELLALLGVSAAQVASLDRGDIIAQKMGETTAKELAMGVVMYIPEPPAKVVSYFDRANLASIDRDITADGEIPPHAGVDAFKSFALTPVQAEEAEDLLAAESGDEFNLSSEEIASLAQLKKTLSSRNTTALVNAVSQAYREILWRRWQAYRKQGLAGIVPYARDDGESDPAAELRTAAKSSKVLQRYFPDLYKAWLNYPAALPAGTEERFYWLNRKVEGRPTAILGHRIMQTAGSGTMLVLRQYYVGHSYNSSHIVIGSLPFRDGTIVFYAQRTFTDQVAGIGSGLKRNIGREQMKEQMINRLERLRSEIRSF